MTPQQINEQLQIPAHQSSTPIKEAEALFLYEFIKSKQLVRTCETGFGFARSASHIMAASEATHIVMDPFQSNYEYGGLKNIERLGLRAKLDFREAYSHNVLPQLVAEKRSFQFIFIDGDHRFDGCFVDYFYADLLLEPNGYLLFHDTWMRPIQLVMNFIHTNRPEYKKIATPLRNFALYQKVGTDTRGGMTHKEFYNFKSFITHTLIYWLNNGKTNALKSLVLALKNKLK
jgi:predicted O-methyltransferase YrrM